MARVKSFRAEYGTSIEIKGAWHKLSCSLEVELDESDKLDDVKRRVWNTVYNEIETQIKDIIGA